MWGRRIRSALFIDYENVGPVCPPDALANWLRWFEDGAFDAGRKRKLVCKRVYRTRISERHETAFRLHGFDIVVCEKVVRRKNGADIRISLDVTDSLVSRLRLREVILITRDSDFVPLLEWLARKKMLSAILVDEQEERVAEAFSLHADALIPVSLLRQASRYLPDDRRYGIRRRLSHLKRYCASMRPARRGTPDPATREAALAAAAELTIAVASQKPNQCTARAAIEKELRKIPGFTTRGDGSYLGLGSYGALIAEVARRCERLEVSESRALSVRYVRGFAES